MCVAAEVCLLGLVGLDLDLVSGGQERVEPNYQLRVSLNIE